MTIKELIASLERRAELSDKGLDAQVTLTLHTVEHNSSGFYVAAEIDDISNVWGPDLDAVEIEAVLSEKDIDDLYSLKGRYIEL